MPKKKKIESEIKQELQNEEDKPIEHKIELLPEKIDIPQKEESKPVAPVELPVEQTPKKKWSLFKRNKKILVNQTKAPVIKQNINPQNKKKFRWSFITVSFCFGLLLTGGVIYHQKYPLGYQPTQINPNKQSPLVLAVTDKLDEPKSFTPKTNLPEVTGKSYGIYYREKKNGTDSEFLELAGKNERIALPMASITKLMTALVALDQYELDKEVKVPLNCQNIKDGSNVGFLGDEIFSLQDLLYGLLVKSGADAGCTIANIEDPTDFVQKMNKKATEIGMKNTKFQNVIGFDAGGQQSSTIEDIKLLTEEVLKSSILRKIIGSQVIEIKSKNTLSIYKFENTNDLLKTIPGTIGVKTGYTENAGECLSYLYTDRNYEIMIIILGSQKRFEDTKSLLDWAKSEISAYNQPKS